MKKLRAGVIGAGSWAVHAHIPTLAENKNVELVSLCRRDTAILHKLQKQFGFQVATENFEEAIDQELDIVIVASPSSFHFDQTKLALISGAHVLCEKPMTIASHEAWDLVKTAEKVDKQLLIAFGWNYMPIFEHAKTLLTQYGIGELEQVTIHMSSQTRELLSATGAYPDADPETIPNSDTWTNPKLSGGGYAQAQMSHALGLLFGLFPVRAKEVHSLMKSVLNAKVETHAVLAIKFDNTAIGSVSGGSSHTGAWGNKHELELRAIGSEGQIIIDLHRELVWLFRSDGTEVKVKLDEGDGNYRAKGPAEALIKVAMGDISRNLAPGELGARTVETLEMAYQGELSCGSVR